ncbi:ABC transporter ATP-binding protein [Mesorhizobium argentiipisi]|uniref:ATP-binding cassette domain-containing protein n=1 Tax=Mesorhizobium argentiipisi TaxID=3015175 RepID=A0ABU8KB35_9HYPH
MELLLKNVSHRYGSVEVLSDVSLRIPRGEIMCIIGPSGCGKSALLRLLGGLERPTEGMVLQVGAPPAESLNPLTYVFQHLALLPWRSVEGNVKLVLEDHKLAAKDVERIVADVLARTGLSEFRATLPKQLSGGMRQRVAIARALAVSPAVMLMDEPTSALDSQTRELLMDDLVSLWTRQPFTAVYVTHDLSEAVRLGHRIVVLSRRPGRIRDMLTIEQPLAERYAGAPVLEKMQLQLWALMRDEAMAADQELLDG